MRGRLWVVVSLLFLAKTSITTLFRGVYPFAPHFADSLGVSEATFLTILSFGELVGAICPIFGA